jgi:hypothetical protein
MSVLLDAKIHAMGYKDHSSNQVTTCAIEECQSQNSFSNQVTICDIEKMSVLYQPPLSGHHSCHRGRTIHLDQVTICTTRECQSCTNLPNQVTICAIGGGPFILIRSPSVPQENFILVPTSLIRSPLMP